MKIKFFILTTFVFFAVLFLGIFQFIDKSNIPVVHAASITSVKSGSWSDSTVWSTNTVPTTGDTVTIAAGHTITYNVLSDAVLGDVNINGKLYFSRATSTRLKTNGNILVMMGGFLDMGTPADQIPKNIKAEVIWRLTPAQAAAYVGGFGFAATDKGLWAMDGSRWETHGAPLTRTWSKLVQHASAGATTLVVEHDVTDWYIGGTVVISQTSNPMKSGWPPKWENEPRTITVLEKLPDGKTKVTLDKPLTYFHEGTAPFQAEVGLLTRNVRFETEIVGVTDDYFVRGENDVTKRTFAHTMYMTGSKGNMQYAEFKKMGHYLKVSRYPIHTHQLGAGSKGMMIRGNGLWLTGFRWVNIHSSDGVTVEDNVGFSSVATGYFSEADFTNLGGGRYRLDAISHDVAYIHNLGIEATSLPFECRKGCLPEGLAEFKRMGAFWPDNAEGEAHIGNVAVATRVFNDEGSSESSGFPFSETVFGGPGGTIGQIFIKNEGHSHQEAGIFTWTNRHVDLDYVDVSMWRNGKNGMFAGAYTGEMFVYGSKFLENQGSGISSTVTDFFVQDSILGGSPKGWEILAYFKPQRPQEPHWNVRNTYKDSPIGHTHLHDPCATAGEEKKVLTLDCAADYTFTMGNTYENVAKPIDFGWQANANSWHKLAGLQGVPASFQGNSYVLRPDQDVEANRGPESSRAIAEGIASGGTITKNTIADAQQIGIGSWADYPPKASLTANLDGKVATLTATATDDKAVTKIEIYLDWLKIKECASSPCTATYDLTTYPRKYAYFYARAFDNSPVIYKLSLDGKDNCCPYPQRAYSSVIELGPEVLLQGQSLPPQPTPTPTPSPLPTASSFDKLYIFLDKVEKITLTGSNLTGTFNVTFLQTGIQKLTFTSITGGSDKLELDFTTKDLAAVPLGEYTVQVTRISDSLTLTHPKTFVFTRLGDLWKQGATETTEQKRDGKVDINDVSRLLSKWNSTNPQDLLEADVNAGPNNVSQGKIDIYDANRLMANWTN